MKKTKAKKKKVIKQIPIGRIYIRSSFNNTIITVTDDNGNVVAWASCGSVGFRGTKKSTPYASIQAAKAAIEKAKNLGLQKARVFVSGVGAGRESAVRALGNSGIEIISIKDITPVPHNGCRPKKPRRV